MLHTWPLLSLSLSSLSQSLQCGCFLHQKHIFITTIKRPGAGCRTPIASKHNRSPFTTNARKWKRKWSACIWLTGDGLENMEKREEKNRTDLSGNHVFILWITYSLRFHLLRCIISEYSVGRRNDYVCSREHGHRRKWHCVLINEYQLGRTHANTHNAYAAQHSHACDIYIYM